MEYALIYEIPIGIILLITCYYCAKQTTADDFIEE